MRCCGPSVITEATDDTRIGKERKREKDPLLRGVYGLSLSRVRLVPCGDFSLLSFFFCPRGRDSFWLYTELCARHPETGASQYTVYIGIS